MIYFILQGTEKEAKRENVPISGT